MKINKKEILLEIENAAKNYKETLVGKTFLYIFNNNFIEVIFKTNNFMHLCGVASNAKHFITAGKFYKLAISRKLTIKQFDFTKAHPYDLYKRKIQHLTELSKLANCDCYMLEDITTKTATYKFGASDMNMTICFNLPTDEHGNIKGNVYNAFSLRDENCISKSKNCYKVDYIFVKNNNEKQYNEIVFKHKLASISKIPNAILNKLNCKI